MLLVPALSLFSVLNKNLLSSEMLYVWKFFSNSPSDCFNKSHVTRATFLDHTRHLFVHSQLRPERSAWALSPRLCLEPSPLLSGPSQSRPLQGHQELPPAWGRLSVLSLGGFRGVKWMKQEVPVGSPSCLTAARSHLLSFFI